MKRPLNWHQECLQNWTASLHKEKEALDRAIANHEMNKKNWAHYQMQIRLAIREGKFGFDREKYKKERTYESMD